MHVRGECMHSLEGNVKEDGDENEEAAFCVGSCIPCIDFGFNGNLGIGVPFHGGSQEGVSLASNQESNASSSPSTYTIKDPHQHMIGNTSKSWAKLDVGQVLSHSFELKSKTKGLFYGSPAVVTFRVPSKGVLQAYSTPILPLDVLAETIPEKKLDLVMRLSV
ncbi:hypothetical protein Bca52824_054864 [Brassica carinata]|uniref:Uncharacterized protein n=1 Tax=Brassica carinata TaxID=52824 RepID=A0A8X7RE75_BRACI|nr:hypothetical protein Bca52824_054864 [Brassica carinata]